MSLKNLLFIWMAFKQQQPMLWNEDIGQAWGVRGIHTDKHVAPLLHNQVNSTKSQAELESWGVLRAG
jgi:hypothetical protein